MINKLRFKFIKITMGSVFAVLFLIIAAVNVVSIVHNNRSVDFVTQIIVDYIGSFSKFNIPFNRDHRDKTEQGNTFDRFYNRVDLPVSSRFFFVLFDENMNIIGGDNESFAFFSENDIMTTTNTVISKNKSTGWYKNYRYRLNEFSDGFILVFFEASETRESILTVFAITIIVGIAAFSVIFLLISLFSKQAIKPIAQTYEKQRQFITDASHELKTPLTVVSANNEILAMSYGNNEWCEGIEKQISSMRSLIGQMIQMSKLDEDEQEYVFENFDLSGAVYDTAMTFKNVAERKGLKMSVDIEPDIYFNGDENAIRHTISILSDNAVKYCDADGEIRVSVSRRSIGLKKKICISVENTYAYIDSLDTDKIFERFYRADKARSSSNSFGLGLSIARAIIEKHNGVIEAKNKQGYLVMEICF